MEIGMVLPEFRPVAAGAERMAEALSRRLVNDGHDVWVLTGHWRAEDVRFERDGNLRIIRHATLWNGFGCPMLWRLGRYVYLCSLAWHLIWRGRRWQVWHVHQALTWAAVSVWVARWFRKPVVIKVTAGPLEFDLNMVRPWCRPLILKAQRLVCVSVAGRQRLLASGGQPEQVVVIPNGVDLQRFSPTVEAGGSTFIFVGRFEWVKGIDLLLQAMAQLRRANRLGAWKLQIVGWGSQLRIFQRAAIALEIAESVEWLGSRDDVPNLLRRSRVFIQPSRSEGMSNSLLEAMASGLPCVATDVGGTREVFGYGVPGDMVSAVTQTPVGFLVPPESAEGLAEAMGRLMEQPALRRDIGVAARQRIEAAFTLDQTTQAYEALYQQLLNGGRG